MADLSVQDDSGTSLKGWARAGFEAAKGRNKGASRIQWAALATVVIGLLLQEVAHVAYAAGAIALVCQVAVWLLQRSARNLHHLASTAHRRAMLTDAFGKFEHLDAADIVPEFPEGLAALAAKLDDGAYYASTHGPGADRLAGHLQESAFWSRHLYRRAAQAAYLAFAVKLSVVVAAVLISLPAAGEGVGVQIARIIVVVLGALIAQNDLGKAELWSAAARAAGDVDRRVEASFGGTEKMLAIFADYHVATALAPPIPTRVYDNNRNRLNALWARERATASGNSR